MKGLPLAYNKDLQETQEPLYDAVETLTACLRVSAGMVATMEIDRAAVTAAVRGGHLLATELADYLVGVGVPFRQAHDMVGGLVRLAEGRGVELADLSLEDYRAAHPVFGRDLYDWLDVARAVNRRDLVGGPAQERVAGEILRVRVELGAATAPDPNEIDPTHPRSSRDET